eukprot:gene10762-10918_t
MKSAAAFFDVWLQYPWLLWGVGSVLSSGVGFYLAAFVLEQVLSCGWLDNSLICYTSSNDVPRKQLLAATHKRIPFSKQFKGCFHTLFGLQCIVNGAVLALIMQWAHGGRSVTWLPATAVSAVLQFVGLAVMADFGLYWGHRVQHESKFLWRFHSYHHAIDTPSPFSTLYIHPVDAALQGGIPLALAAVVVRPNPVILYLFLAARLAENAINHSGFDSWLVNLLTLKLLPFRALPAFHDAHHKYSNHALNAKNYGESFWVWDAVFGTSSLLVGHKPSGQAPAVAVTTSTSI